VAADNRLEESEEDAEMKLPDEEALKAYNGAFKE
jgi:hypothetical protein